MYNNWPVLAISPSDHIPLVIDPRTQWHVNTTIFLITLGRLGACGREGGGVKEEMLGSCVCVWGGVVKEERLRSCVHVGRGGVKEERSFT